MPEGRCVNVCGLKYIQKKNNSFKGFQQFSFFNRWRKIKKSEREQKSLQWRLMDNCEASSWRDKNYILE